MKQHPSVSKEHAMIQVAQSGQLFLKDLSSLNGNYVNGLRLESGGQRLLRESDVLQFGKGKLR